MESETPTVSGPEFTERRSVPRAAPRIFAATVVVVAAATLSQVIAPITSGSQQSPTPPDAPASAGIGIAASSPGASGADAGPASRTRP